MELHEVFNAAGMPKETYVDRLDGKLLVRLKDARRFNKVVMVTGLTKSGKTVLVRKSLEGEKHIWLDGGTFSDESSFWNTLLDELGGFSKVGHIQSDSNNKTFDSKIGGGPIPAGVGGSLSTGSEETWNQVREIPSKSMVIKLLKEYKIPVIIDDFHYLNDSFKREIVRAFKALVFDDVPIILISIPHRKSGVLKSEREMTGRFENLNIPKWTEDDLRKIADVGFPLLGTMVSLGIRNALAEQSRGSPCLMQEFCVELCLKNDIRNTSNGRVLSNINPNIFSEIAEKNGRDIFERLKAGPITNRKKRALFTLISGGREDIYGLILLALKKLKPGVGTINYDDLREAISEFTNDFIKREQVVNYLGHMSKISLNDSASSPVVDWENDGCFLHVTDPFFSFFLEWSK